MNEFVQQALEETKRILSEKGLDCQVELTSVVKANDLVKSGICIKQSDKQIGVNLYLDEIESSTSVKDLIEQRLYSLLHTTERPTQETYMDLSFDKIRSKLRVRIVDTTCNKRYLATVVHQDIQETDLSIIPEIRHEHSYGFYSAVITNEMAKNQDYDLEQLITTAMTCSFIYDHPKIFPLNSVFDPDVDIYKKHEIDGSQIYVLTSASGQMGAYTMVNKDILDYLASNIGSFTILPSSRHEVLIVPDTLGLEETHLRQMVRDANRAVVSAEDFLSDDIFAYSVETGLRRLREQVVKEKPLQANLFSGL